MDATSLEFWARILVSLVCGGIIGLERQIRGKPAGIRTSILICLGTQVFVSQGTSLAGGDHYRVLAQVVTGVGFLGAGLMISQEGMVRGVTSAAVIWMLAAIGATIGLGRQKEALVLVLVTVGVLSGVEYLENSIRRLRSGVHARHQSFEKQGHKRGRKL
ncbi:MAG: MgtC/SapB family protein [Deltaproteobacteria bacterium]|jgi:putative Mg2+ transporter-C (MgtC) family protein|nr:MgtC/SapB family protein [Deltaproteobacteria bacterium]